MVRELDRFCWTMLVVWVMSHRYFRAAMEDWKITTVLTAMMPAFDVQTLEVRIIDEKLFLIYVNSLD